VEESNRDFEGGGEDRPNMSVFRINHTAVILSADGEGSQDLSNAVRRTEFQRFLASLGMTN
jgi:hypothetical protein